MSTFLVTLGSVVTNMSVQFVGSCKCTFVPCCPVQFDFALFYCCL